MGRMNQASIRQLLMDSIEHHYGKISTAIVSGVDVSHLCGELSALVEKYSNPT